MEWLADPQIWIAFFTLTALEIVLGIDNIIFISILVGRLPKEQQDKGRYIGLAMALILRVLLLLSLTWIMGLTDDLFSVFGNGISGRDLILILGGGFLLAKSTLEIHHALEEDPSDNMAAKGGASFASVIGQIAVIDVVFSLDSVITAVGLVEQISVMIAAVVIAVIFMMLASGPISRFIETHPTLKMLALSFLILIGFTLMGEGWGLHVPKGYIYFAMAFSVGVEFLNIKVRAKRKAKAA
ncbi:integral membrane protein TerC [gamma proteobacterium HTCC5015]|nr:integral membrane protein TerC [gamma proteobacterium HTCC5015]